MLTLLLPFGMLRRPCCELLETAGIGIERTGPRSLTANPNCKLIGSIVFTDPSVIPEAVASDRSHVGITGLDWIKEYSLSQNIPEGSEGVTALTRLHFNGVNRNDWHLFFAHNNGTAIEPTLKNWVGDVHIYTQYPHITRRHLRSINRKGYIHTVPRAPEGIAHAHNFFCVGKARTHRTREQNGLQLISCIMSSHPVLIASPRMMTETGKEAAMARELSALLSEIDLGQ